MERNFFLQLADSIMRLAFWLVRAGGGDEQEFLRSATAAGRSVGQEAIRDLHRDTRRVRKMTREINLAHAHR